MVEAAEADVVRPAVAADDPDGHRHQCVREAVERTGAVVRAAREPGPQLHDQFPLPGDAVLVLGPGLVLDEGAREIAAHLVGHLGEQPSGLLALRVGAQPHAEPELRVVLEQRVAPGRSAAEGVRGPRGRRQVAAVDGRAAGRVGDDHAVAELLAEQLQVGRLAAAGAGAGELEERLQQLRALDRVVPHGAAVDLGDAEEEVVADALDVAVLDRRQQVDGLVLRLGLAARRAHVDADAAAGAVVGRHLDRQPGAGRELAPAVRLAEEVVGSAREVLGGEGLHADGRVRAHDGALAAVDAQVGVPDGDRVGEAALLPPGRPGREGAVDGQGADGQQVALAGQHPGSDVAHEVRGAGGHGGQHAHARSPRSCAAPRGASRAAPGRPRRGCARRRCGRGACRPSRCSP